MNKETVRCPRSSNSGSLERHVCAGFEQRRQQLQKQHPAVKHLGLACCWVHVLKGITMLHILVHQTDGARDSFGLTDLKKKKSFIQIPTVSLANVSGLHQDMISSDLLIDSQLWTMMVWSGNVCRMICRNLNKNSFHRSVQPKPSLALHLKNVFFSSDHIWEASDACFWSLQDISSCCSRTFLHLSNPSLNQLVVPVPSWRHYITFILTSRTISGSNKSNQLNILRPTSYGLFFHFIFLIWLLNWKDEK